MIQPNLLNILIFVFGPNLIHSKIQQDHVITMVFIVELLVLGIIAFDS